MSDPAITQRTRATGRHRALDARRLRGSLALSAAVIAVALTGSASASATTVPAGPAPTTTVPVASGATTQGIIMRDGGICDPIRHMGC